MGQIHFFYNVSEDLVLTILEPNCLYFSILADPGTTQSSILCVCVYVCIHTHTHTHNIMCTKQIKHWPIIISNAITKERAKVLLLETAELINILRMSPFIPIALQQHFTPQSNYEEQAWCPLYRSEFSYKPRHWVGRTIFAALLTCAFTYATTATVRHSTSHTTLSPLGKRISLTVGWRALGVLGIFRGPRE